ncbi:MAG TPA: hypothetical protein VI386_13875 [Candidatus Sulfotelmatobacter sp.]
MRRDLDHYLTLDHAARQRTMVISVMAGAFVGTIAELYGASHKHAFMICFFMVAFIEFVAWPLGYTKISPVASGSEGLPIRRYVIRAALSSAAILFLALLRIPNIEAAYLGRKLLEMTNKDIPQPEKINALLDSAIENGIPIRDSGIEAAKRQMLRIATAANSKPGAPSRSPAADTVGHLEAYTLYEAAGVRLRLSSSVLFFPASVLSLDAPVFAQDLSSIGADPNATIINVRFKCTREMAAALNYGPNMQSDALIGRLTATGRNVTFPDAPEFVRKLPLSAPHAVAVVEITISDLRQTLDGIIWVNVVFERCSIAYQGGSLHIDRVIFRNCEFFASDNAGKQVLNALSLQDGRRVTLYRP